MMKGAISEVEVHVVSWAPQTSAHDEISELYKQISGSTGTL